MRTTSDARPAGWYDRRVLPWLTDLACGIGVVRDDDHLYRCGGQIRFD